MKKLFLIAALTAVSFTGFSQDDAAAKPLSFSIGLEAALPIGDFADFSSFGIGGSAQADYMVAPSVAITLNAGYVSYAAKSVKVPTGVDGSGNIIYSNVKGDALGLIPVLAGIKYWFTPMVYGSGQLGLSFASGKGNSGSNFTYAPGIGVKFSNIDLLLKYVGISAKGGGGSLNAIGLRAAYNF